MTAAFAAAFTLGATTFATALAATTAFGGNVKAFAGATTTLGKAYTATFWATTGIFGVSNFF